MQVTGPGAAAIAMHAAQRAAVQQLGVHAKALEHGGQTVDWSHGGAVRLDEKV
jgi:hypothetical protein